jgi:hypothetical protein
MRLVDQVRVLRAAIKADEQQLELAPLGRRQKTGLQKQIDYNRQELRKKIAVRRAEKKKASK